MSHRPYALELVSVDGEQPVEFFTEAKRHLKGSDDDDSDDGLIKLYLDAAADWAESYTNRALALQTWRIKLDCFPYYGDGGDSRQGIKLPKPPLQAVSEIKYYDTAGVLTTLSSADYEVDKTSAPGMIFPAYNKSWPAAQDRPHAVQVLFQCGYLKAADIPSAIKAAVLLQLGHLYEHRETVVIGAQPFEVPQSAERLCLPLRILNV